MLGCQTGFSSSLSQRFSLEPYHQCHTGAGLGLSVLLWGHCNATAYRDMRRVWERTTYTVDTSVHNLVLLLWNVLFNLFLGFSEAWDSQGMVLLYNPVFFKVTVEPTSHFCGSTKERVCFFLFNKNKFNRRFLVRMLTP